MLDLNKWGRKTKSILFHPVFEDVSARTKTAIRAVTCATLCTAVALLYSVKVKSYDPHLVNDVKPITWSVKNSERDFSRMNYQEAIEYVQTPAQAHEYRNWLCSRKNHVFDQGTFLSGFKKVHEGRSPVDCSEVAYAAAALLSDNGYPPLILALTPYRLFKSRGHVVFVYKQHGRFGSLGIEPDDRQEPIHESIDALAHTLTKDNADPQKPQNTYRYYSLFNLNENDPDYITTERDLHRLFLRDALTRMSVK